MGHGRDFLNFGDVLDFEKTLNFALFQDQSKAALRISGEITCLHLQLIFCLNRYVNFCGCTNIRTPHYQLAH